MAAIREARIRRVYCGAYRAIDAAKPKEPDVYYGIEEDACTKLLQDFFQKRRIQL
jgi:tRNA(Arg) A34 adenosine deaminase TadA